MSTNDIFEQNDAKYRLISGSIQLFGTCVILDSIISHHLTKPEPRFPTTDDKRRTLVTLVSNSEANEVVKLLASSSVSLKGKTIQDWS